MGAKEFQPDWVSPPGDTVLSCMRAKAITLRQLMADLDLLSIDAARLFCGQHPIDETLAEKLATFCGSTKEFWMKLEAQFRADVNRLKLGRLYDPNND